MDAPQLKSVYLAEDFDTLGFHDCYVHGIRWSATRSSLTLDMDYIVEWIQSNGTIKFWVVPAELTFDYASDVQLSLDWEKSAMECQIDDVVKLERKQTPNGSKVFHWEIAFAVPQGSILLWASDVALNIQGEPLLLATQRIRGGNFGNTA